MTGSIIYEPPIPSPCDQDDCAGKPTAALYRDGTIWQCHSCNRKYEVWSGDQYNEAFSAWRRTA